jgi:hypothetical protein
VVIPIPGMPGGRGQGDPELDLLQLQRAEALANMTSNLELAPAPKKKNKKSARKPTPEYVQSLARRMEDFWNPRDARMDEDYALYQQRFVENQRVYQRLLRESGIDEQSGEIVTRNIPWVLVEKAASILGKANPSIDVIPQDPRLREAAQRIEDFLRWCWEVWNRRWMSSLHGPILRDIAHYLCLRGWVTIRVRYDPDDEELPVHVDLADPRQIYPVLGSSGIRAIIHKRYLMASEALDEWPEAEKILRGTPDDEIIEEISYYDDTWHAVLIEGAWVKPPTKHEYGFLPWIVATGLGAPIRATGSDDTSWVRTVGESIFAGIKNSYLALNKLLSQLATEVARMANPPTVYYYDPARPDEPRRIDLDAGATNFLYFDRERVDILQLTPNPANSAPILNALMDDIEKGGLPGVLWGVGQGSGFALSLQADAAMDTLQPLTQTMERIIEEVNRRALELLATLHDRPIGYFTRDPMTGAWISGVSVTPELIAAVGTRSVVRLRKVQPRDRAQMAQLAALLTDKKLISLETARDEFLGLDNPQRENERVLADLAYMDPDVTKEVLIPWALAKTDPVLLELWRLAKERKIMEEQRKKEREQQQQAPQPPAAPPAPPGLPPEVLPPQMAGGMDYLFHSMASGEGGMGETGPVQTPTGLPI